MEIIRLTCKRCKDVTCPHYGEDQEANWSCYSTTGECRRNLNNFNVQENSELFMKLMMELLGK